ncbi:glycosyltransferase family 9 protein [bacterium]|nr:MAG: glycosyltransferase family 9 protein [bacterium]
MNVPLLRKLDYWLGIPLCGVLTACRRIFGSSKEIPGGKIRSILFVKLAEQGSTVLARPAILRAIEEAGRDHVHFLVFDENRHILDAMNLVPPGNIHTVPSSGAFDTLLGCLAAVRVLQKLEFDAAVDLEFFSRGTAVLSYLSGAKRRAGYHVPELTGPYRGDLFTERLSFNPVLHTEDGFLSLVEAAISSPPYAPALDWRPPERFERGPVFSPSWEDLEWLKNVREEFHASGAPLILLNTNAGELLPLRRWPGENFVALAKNLLERYPEIKIAFTGTGGEAGLVEALAAKTGSSRCFSLAGRTSISRLLALMENSEALVTSDSGPSHFASLTGIGTVTLFGPETPLLFAARTARNRVITSGLACSPCMNAFNGRSSNCKRNICMERITVEEVFEAVCRIYEERKR